MTTTNKHTADTSYKKNTGIKRIIKAGYYSYKGIIAAIKYEEAFKQEFILTLIFLPLACWVDVTSIERILLIATLLLILIVELLNSAIEAVVDRVSHDLHELSGRAKDMGSAAVLISIMLWLYTWTMIVFVPFFKQL